MKRNGPETNLDQESDDFDDFLSGVDLDEIDVMARNQINIKLEGELNGELINLRQKCVYQEEELKRAQNKILELENGITNKRLKMDSEVNKEIQKLQNLVNFQSEIIKSHNSKNRKVFASTQLKSDQNASQQESEPEESLAFRKINMNYTVVCNLANETYFMEEPILDQIKRVERMGNDENRVKLLYHIFTTLLEEGFEEMEKISKLIQVSDFGSFYLHMCAFVKTLSHEKLEMKLYSFYLNKLIHFNELFKSQLYFERKNELTALNNSFLYALAANHENVKKCLSNFEDFYLSTMKFLSLVIELDLIEFSVITNKHQNSYIKELTINMLANVLHTQNNIHFYNFIMTTLLEKNKN